METEGDNFDLLYGNEYEEFSPISSEVRDRLLELDGVNREDSYVMEGAYLMTTISGKGIRPLEENGQPLKEKEDSMLEGFTEEERDSAEAFLIRMADNSYRHIIANKGKE